MANLVDTSVNGDLRVTGTMFGTQAGNYATCATAGATAAKTATISGFTLTTGIHVYVKFSENNSAAVGSLTLNISGTGAKPIKCRGGNNLGTSGSIAANGIYEFAYDGTNWEMVGSAVTGVKGANESSYRWGNVNITAENVGAAASSHTHGNIANGGTLQTNDITIANGDKLVVTDSSDSSKVARASIAFDGSTTTQALTKAGTWATFNNYSLPLAASGTRGGIQIGYSESGTNYAVKLSSEKAYVTVPWTDTKVTQTADDASTGTGFELLFSATEDNTTRTEASRKSSKLTYQPSTGTLKSTAYNVNSKCTLQFNTTTNALDFVFA